jgi:hypothetical protein
VKIQSLPLPDPVVDQERLAAIEEQYLATCFRPVTMSQPHDEVVFTAPTPGRPRWDTDDA